MRHTNTHIPARAKKILSAWTIASIVLTLVRGPSAMVQTAEAASSFRPTIFVNTEAFLIIDDDDTSSDVVMRFGDTLAKTLSFNRLMSRFEFNDDVYTSGSLTASGTIVTESGAYIDGTTLVVQANSDRVGIGTAAPLADLHVVGTETRLDTGTTNGTTSLSFVDNDDEKAHFLLNQATGTFDIQSDGRIDISSTDYVNVSGTNYTNIQGSTTFTGNNVGIGTTGPKTRLDVVGAISGSFVYATKSFSGAGLTDCDTAGTSKLMWDATTGRFSCGTDQSGSYTAGQGLTLTSTSFKVNDTLTGTLLKFATATGSLARFVTLSGSTVYAKNALRSSGSLTWEGQGSGAKLFVKDFLSVGSVASGSLLTVGRVGTGTTRATMTNATLFSLDQMSLGQLAGGAYFGRVGLKEEQWGISNVGTVWQPRDSSRAWNGFATSSDGRYQTAAVSNGWLYISTDYGNTWTSKTSTNRLWSDVAMSADGKIQTAVAEGIVATSYDYGATWTEAATSIHSRHLSMSADGKIQMYVGFTESAYVSSDYGKTWVTRASNAQWSCSAMSSDGKIMLIATNNGTGKISFDYGVTWSNTNAAGESCAMSGDGKYQAMTTNVGNFITISSDYGATWTTKLSSVSPLDIDVSSDGSTMVAVTSSNSIYVSTNYGNTWTAKGSSAVRNRVAMSSDGKTIVTGISSGTIEVSSSDSFQYGSIAIGTGSVKGNTKLMVQGILSGVTLYATKSFSGAGLSDCDTAGTSKLLWDATTGRFSCGTDQGAAYTAGQGLTLNGTSFRLSDSVSGTLLEFQTVSGATVYAERQLSVSGSATLGEDAADNVVFNADVNSNITPNTNNSFDFGSSSARWANLWANNANLSANISVLGTSSLTGNVGIGSANTTTKAALNVSGVMSGVTVYATRSFSGAGLSDCDTAGTSKLLWDATTGRFSCGTDTDTNTTYTAGQGLTLTSTSFKTNATLTGTLLKFATATGTLVRFATVSGSTVFAKNTLSTSGSFILSGPNPRLLTTYNSAGNASGIAVDNRYVYVADDGNGLLILDASKPGTTPTLIGQYDTPGNATGVAVAGRYAYVADGIAGLHIIDVLNPSNPRLIGTYNTSDTAYAVAVSGKYAYVADGSSGMHIINVEDPRNPTLTGTFSSVGNIRDVAVRGNYAYIGDVTSLVMRVIDVSDPTSPIQRGSVSAGDAVYGVAVDDRYAYIACNGAGMKIVDVSNPSSPTVIGTYNTPGAAVKVDVGGRYVYVADYNTGGLQIIDIADPTAPVSAGSYLTASYVFDVAISGRYVYLADYQQGMDTIQINGIDAPTATIGTIDTHNLNVFNSARIASTLSVNGGVNVAGGMHVLGQSSLFTASGAALTLTQSGAKVPVLMNVRGLFSGATLYARTTLRSSGSLVWEGAASGATLYLGGKLEGAGLSDCDNATNSKLLWDATTGRFSCGTDQTGGGSLSLSDGDARYVRKSGDTMTGTLAVQNGNTHSATTTPLINVRGTMSGRLLTISGSGASPLLTTTAVKPTVRIGGSGSLVIEARSTDPGSAPENTASLFTQKVGGRAMLHQGSGSTFAASPLQNALFGNMIMSITTGAGTTVNGYGTTVTNDTTVSHPATDQTFGYMTNFATAATANDEAGTSSTNTAFFRGSTAGANGFFYYARVGVVDTTSITVFSGMADQTIATMVGADNPAGNHVGFQFSTGRGDTNWMFTTKDNTTQNANSTGLAFTANKVYDLMFTCTKQCASITWEIRNVTDGTSAKGTTSTNLPAAGTAMRMVLGVETETTAARNIRMQQLYVEVDR